MKNLFFTLLTVASFTSNINAQTTCPEFMVSPNIYAGLEIGSRGMKPTIIRFEEAENGKTSFITLSRDLMPINTNPAKAKTVADIDCTVDFVCRYVNVFRNDPYNVPDSRIVLVMSSGLKAKLANNDSLLYALKDKVKRRTGIALQELSEKEEGGDKVNQLIVDEEYINASVNVFDIGSGNITGGFNNGNEINSFATDGSVNSIVNYLKTEIEKQNLNIKLPRERSIIAKMASDRFKEKHLVQMNFNNKAQDVVCGGGSTFAMMAWYKVESMGDKRLNQFFTSYVYDYYTSLINSQDKEEFFKNNRAKDNSPLTLKGKSRLADAKAVFNDLELLAGAAILKTTCDDLEKRGIRNFFFDDQIVAQA